MLFILSGVILVALKLAGLSPVADWSWFAVLAPFALAVAWWAWSDSSGRTKRQGMQKDQARKQERRRSLAQGMGLQGLFDRSVGAKLRRAEAKDKAVRQRQIDKVEKERERKRQANRDSILTTRMDSKFDSRFDAPAPAQTQGVVGDTARKIAAP
jgi:small Trp-rich protein